MKLVFENIRYLQICRSHIGKLCTNSCINVHCTYNMYIRVINFWPFLKLWLMGQMIDSTSLNSEQFSFFSVYFPIFEDSILKFWKIKGGTIWWKKYEKNIFLCLIPQKNHLEKCRLTVKSFFKTLIFGEVMDKKVLKNS